MAVLSMAAAGEATAQCLGQLLCCLPKMSVPDSLTYDRVFRVAIVATDLLLLERIADRLS